MLRATGGITRQQAASLVSPGYPPASGAWFTSQQTAVAVAAADTLYLYWVPIAADLAVTLLRTRCTAGGAGSAVKFALWRNDPATARPTGVPIIGQNTGLSTATSGTWQDLVVPSTRLGTTAGVWFGSKFTGTLPTMITSGSLAGSQAFYGRFPAGTMPTAPQGNYSFADAYANDIMALNLTGASLTSVANSVPAFAMEWA